MSENAEKAEKAVAAVQKAIKTTSSVSLKEHLSTILKFIENSNEVTLSKVIRSCQVVWPAGNVSYATFDTKSRKMVAGSTNLYHYVKTSVTVENFRDVIHAKEGKIYWL